MTTKKVQILPNLIKSINALENLRNAVIKCICEYHRISDYEKYTNSEASFEYIYSHTDKSDEILVKLYRKIENNHNDYVINRDESRVHIEPEIISYAHEHTTLTPVNIVNSVLLSKYQFDVLMHYELRM